MKLIRVFLAATAVAIASFAFSSCVNEAPEINYVVEYTHNSDFSSIIAAINSQTNSIAEKLAAVETAVKNGFLSMEEASGALKDALVESLNNQNASLSDIQQAIASQNLLLEDKLDVLNAAIATQTATLDDALESIEMSVDTQTEALKAKLDLLAETIETGSVNIVDALNEFEETMDEAIGSLEDTVDDGFGDVTQATNAQTTAMGIMTASIVRAISNGVTTLSQALADIEEAIDDQTDTLEAELEVIAGAIADNATTISEAMEALGEVIEGAIEQGVSDLDDIIDDFADALTDSIGDNTDQLEAIAGSLAQFLEDLGGYNEELAGYVQAIIEAIYGAHGMTPPAPPAPRYEVIDGFLYMNQPAYDEIMAADDPQAALIEKLTENQIDPTVPIITCVRDGRMSYTSNNSNQTYESTASYQESASPEYHAFLYDYADPEDTDDKLVKKVVYYSVKFDFTVTGYGARINGNNYRSLIWSLDAQNWSAGIADSSHERQHGGTVVFNINNVTMVNADGTFANYIYFDYAN